ncbi:MAG: hypothetical protein Q9P14_13470 [candidate division KSB1 bacterium]|nr:hypothetical protein [candidate division KSB1 bacterium]
MDLFDHVAEESRFRDSPLANRCGRKRWTSSSANRIWWVRGDRCGY